MRNVTIAMDEDLHQKVQVDAAKAGLSVSQYIADVLKAAQSQVNHEAEGRLEADLARLQAVFDGPKLDLSEGGRMPSSDERDARRWGLHRQHDFPLHAG